MGDGFTHARREERQARERQSAIDAFFDAVTDYLGMDRKSYTRTGMTSAFKKYDELLYPPRGRTFAHERRLDRLGDFIDRIESARSGGHDAWAFLLAEAKMLASDACFRRLHEVSPFSGEPIVIIVPDGTRREPRILGDWREVCDSLQAGNLPFIRTVPMPERNVTGLSMIDGGRAEEARTSGRDDVRFISF